MSVPSALRLLSGPIHRVGLGAKESNGGWNARRALARGDSEGTAAGTASSTALSLLLGGPEEGVGRVGAHAELVHVGFSCYDGAGGAQLGDNSGIVGAGEAPQNARGCCGGEVGCADVVQIGRASCRERVF